jgi:hypothetical protein
MVGRSIKYGHPNGFSSREQEGGRNISSNIQLVMVGRERSAGQGGARR